MRTAIEGLAELAAISLFISTVLIWAAIAVGA